MRQDSDYDILMISLPRWDGDYTSTSYSLAKELSLKTRVFFIENPFTLKDFFFYLFTGQILRRFFSLLFGKKVFLRPEPLYQNLIIVTPLIVFPINWLPKGRLYSVFLMLNDRIVRRSVRKTINSFDIKQFVFFNSFNPFYGWKSIIPFQPLAFIYQSVDDISNSVYISKHGTYLEKDMIRQADIVLVTSSELLKLKSLISDRVYLVPNAADVSQFNRVVHEKFARPSELNQVPVSKKIICYIGNICHRLDYNLLTNIANFHSDKILLMIGPVTGDSLKNSGLKGISNVVFTGPKPLEDLPQYLYHCHCCIIPFVKNDLTRSIYPLKINEYLAAGKPVVATNFSKDIESFADVTRVCKDAEEFVFTIEDEIRNDSNEKISVRIKRSSDNNWMARAQTIFLILEDQLNEKKPKNH